MRGMAEGGLPLATAGIPQGSEGSVRFIEMTGHALMSMVEPGEVSPEELQQAGLTDSCLVRVNEQGDIEVRRHDRWDLIGGLLGGFAPRAERASGRTWA